MSYFDSIILIRTSTTFITETTSRYLEITGMAKAVSSGSMKIRVLNSQVAMIIKIALHLSQKEL